jgi:hypothetical protein
MVWLAAACLFIMPQTRSLARSLSLAMVGTFPGVFFFQLLAAPVAFGVLVIAWLAWRLIEPGNSSNSENPIVVATSIAAILICLVVFGGMSLLGFCEGWRAGWRISKGHGWRAAIDHGPSARMVRHFWKRGGSAQDAASEFL